MADITLEGWVPLSQAAPLRYLRMRAVEKNSAKRAKRFPLPLPATKNSESHCEDAAIVAADIPSWASNRGNLASEAAAALLLLLALEVGSQGEIQDPAAEQSRSPRIRRDCEFHMQCRLRKHKS